MQQHNKLTEKRVPHRGRGQIGEKSPLSLVRLANQNFTDLQRNSRYLFAQDSVNMLAISSSDLKQASPKQALPKLR